MPELSEFPQFKVKVEHDIPHPRLGDIPTREPGLNGPILTPIASRWYLDASTQQAWANNDMAAIVKRREETAKDLLVFYKPIREGDDTWARVTDPETKQSFYVTWNDTCVLWSYAAKKPSTSNSTGDQDVLVSIGLFCKATNMLGTSGYVWKNIPVAVVPDVVASVFAKARRQLVDVASSRYGDELGNLVEASLLVVQAGTDQGFSITELLGILLPEVLIPTYPDVKQLYSTLNVYNFDAEHKWTSVDSHEDGSQVFNGDWRPHTLDSFTAATKEHFPPGFTPSEDPVGAVNCLSLAFQPDGVICECLGLAVLMAREDDKAGMALKYANHKAKENEIGLQGIDGDTNEFNIEKYYNGDDWVKAQSVDVQSGKYKMTGYTPSLATTEDEISSYYVNIGLPPSVVSE